jgi:hypothetical protein
MRRWPRREQYVQQQPSAGVDETGWHEARRRAWIWVALTGWVTVFAVRLSRGGKVAREMLGDLFAGVVTSDRGTGYNWLRLSQRQVCWALPLEEKGERPSLGQSMIVLQLHEPRRL